MGTVGRVRAAARGEGAAEGQGPATRVTLTPGNRCLGERSPGLLSEGTK